MSRGPMPVDTTRPAATPVPPVAAPPAAPTAPDPTAAPRNRITAAALSATVARTVGSRIAVLLISLATGVLTARMLGPHDRGTIAVAFAYAAVFSALCSAGMETANLRFAGLSGPVHQRTVRLSLRYVATVGVGLTAAWGAAGLLTGPAVRFGLDPAVFALTLVLGPVVLLSSLLGSAEIGRSQASTYNRALVGGMLGYAALLVALAVLDRVTTVTVVVAYLISQLGTTTGLLVRARPVGRPVAGPDEMPAYWPFARRAYLPNLAQFAMVRSQVPVVQALAGAGAVGVYTVAVPFAELLLILPVAFSLTLVPAVATDRADWSMVARMTLRTLLLTVPAAVALAVAAPLVFPLLFGTEFDGAVPVLWSLLPGLTLLAAGRTAQSYLTAHDRPAATTLASLVATGTGLLAMVLLVPRYDAVGAGLGVSAAYLAYVLVMAPAFLRARPTGDARRSPAPRPVRLPWALRPTGTAPTRVLLVLLAVVGSGLAAGASAGQPVTRLALLAGAVVLVAAVVRPAFALYCLAVAVPATQLPLPLAPHPALLLALMYAGLFGTLLRGRPTRRSPYGMLAAGALIVLLALGAIWNDGTSYAVQLVAVPLVSLALLAVSVRQSRRALLAFAFSAAGVAAVHATLALAGVVARGIDPENEALADALARINHNTWGAMFVLAFGIVLAALRGGGSPLLRTATVVAAVTLLAGIGFSYSRSSYIGALLVLLCFAVRRRIVAPLVGIALVVLVLTQATGTPLLPQTITDRIDETTTQDGLDGSSAVRLDLWVSALRMALDHPVSGVGYLGFLDHLPEYFTLRVAGTGLPIDLDRLAYPHNTYLTVLAELGLVGVLLLGTLLGMAVRQVRRRLRTGPDQIADMALFALAGLAACSLFGEPLLTMPVIVPFVLVLTTVTRRAE
ncbi:O-antigen ligase family protein [Micromonospora echinofusca]|uniref:Oligosaccharide flippase family protein n=1 Tax=Micromonospora echinofusca TaxID=47858 RepID=A0ABS3VMQ0_MICEH|nr:O-antigen ligase family protein [Micromonospora echinofusca]MBO4205810.1 oligosaccharide flippase family protein [Micromonospora echinofusca]